MFDTHQTDGEPPPEVPKPELLIGSDEAASAALVKLEAFAEARGFPVTRAGALGEALGTFFLVTRDRPY